MKRMVALTAAATLLTACVSTVAPPPAPASRDGAGVIGASVQRVGPVASDDEIAELTDAQAAFALDLYHTVRDDVVGDLVVAPGSLHTVLAIIRAGARGDTAAEMDAVLHTDGDRMHGAANALDHTLAERDRAGGIDLAVANRLWVQDGFELTDDYVDRVVGNYGAVLATTDFGSDPEAARAEINGWVTEATNDRIDELFPRGTLDNATRLVVTNAVFLDAAWRFPFDPASTSDAPFTLPDGRQVQVPTMHYDEYLPAAVNADWAAVRLPYDGEALSMTVIVPRHLPTFEEYLDVATLGGILDSITDGGIHLSLPRFAAATHLSLDETLAAMGMPRAFGGQADFSGMTGGRDLFLQAVEHEAVVEVDEEGTKAAAASGGSMLGSHGPTVTVDRPFIFLIRDEPTGAVLFLGRVTDPRPEDAAP